MSGKLNVSTSWMVTTRGCSRRPSDLGQILISLASAPASARRPRSELPYMWAEVRESGSGPWSSQFLGASPWVIFKMSVVPSCLIFFFPAVMPPQSQLSCSECCSQVSWVWVFPAPVSIRFQPSLGTGAPVLGMEVFGSFLSLPSCERNLSASITSDCLMHPKNSLHADRRGSRADSRAALATNLAGKKYTKDRIPG